MPPPEGGSESVVTVTAEGSGEVVYKKFVTHFFPTKRNHNHVGKYVQPAPPAPTLDSRTSVEITLNTLVNTEYRRDGGAWQDSPTFTGLSAGTFYEFEQRYKDTATFFASHESESIEITTTGFGGSISSVDVASEGEGAKIAEGGGDVTVTVSSEGSGQKQGIGGIDSDISIAAEGAGAKYTEGSGESTVTIVAESAGIKRGIDGSDTTVSISSDAAGTKIGVGDSDSSVDVTSEGGGKNLTYRSGGSESSVAVVAEGVGHIEDILSLYDLVSCQVDKDLGGSWSVTFRAILETAHSLTEGQEILVEDQPFFVDKRDEVREGEATYLDITAIHRIFKLENAIINEEYTFDGNVLEHIQRLLTYQDDTTMTVAVDPSLTTIEADEFLEITATLDLGLDTIFSDIKEVLQNFLARYRPDGNVIYIMPENHVIDSDIEFEYGVNNVGVQRTYNLDQVTKKLIARAWLRGTVISGAIDPVVVVEYGSGTPARFVDFGTLGSQAQLNSMANRYLSTRQTPDAEYRMTVVDLLRMDVATRPAGISTTPIDVGLGVKVVDAGLGIDETLLVQKYSYSLIEDHIPASITVGTIREDYQERFTNQLISAVDKRDERRPRLYTTTDPTEDPDPEMGKEGDVFVRPA